MNYYNAKILQDGAWKRVRLGPAKASELLNQGFAELEAEQALPPTEILNLLEGYLTGPEKLGEAANAPALLAKVSERVFRGNLRQNSVDGNILRWISGCRDLRLAVETRLSGMETACESLFHQFRRVLLTRVNSVTDSIRAFRQIPLEEQRARGLVPEPAAMIWFVGDGLRYKHVGRDWQHFHERFHALEGRLTDMIDQAFSEGRILCAQDDPKGDQLLPPSVVEPFEEHRPGTDIWYLFSSDLPDGWFSTVSTLPFRRKQAIEWINRAGRQVHASGRRATVEQLQRIARDKFDLTPHAVKTLWGETGFPDKGKKGSISKKHRVSDNEIKAIE